MRHGMSRDGAGFIYNIRKRFKGSLPKVRKAYLLTPRNEKKKGKNSEITTKCIERIKG